MEPVLSHIEITVGDIRRAIPFYDKFLPLLGYRLDRCSEAVLPAHDKHVVSYEHPRLGIAITSPRTELAKERVQRRRPGALHHLAFKVDSRAEVDRLYAQLLEIGAVVDIPPREFPEYSPPGYYALFLRDPDGLRYEIVTY
ncbi:MAG: VOC family protein [Burkholderiales bacterium]|jgi:catechol 2,3-dioxygenase-like lactoylglutathione lyase family enzyme|nr:VOC family protein [Burkholderiales bacterium]